MLYWRWINRPRHPLLSLLLGALGVVVLVGVLMLGFFALVAFAFIGGIVALMRAFTRPHVTASSNHQPTASASDPRVIEGEYVVVRQDAPSLKH